MTRGKLNREQLTAIGVERMVDDASTYMAPILSETAVEAAMLEWEKKTADRLAKMSHDKMFHFMTTPAFTAMVQKALKEVLEPIVHAAVAERLKMLDERIERAIDERWEAEVASLMRSQLDAALVEVRRKFREGRKGE